MKIRTYHYFLKQARFTLPAGRRLMKSVSIDDLGHFTTCTDNTSDFLLEHHEVVEFVEALKSKRTDVLFDFYERWCNFFMQKHLNSEAFRNGHTR